MSSLRSLLALLCCVGPLACLHAQAQSGDIVIEQIVTPRTPVIVVPGATADFTLIVRNDGDAVVPLVTLSSITWDIIPTPQPSYREWLFDEPTNPDCGSVQVEFMDYTPNYGRWRFQLELVDMQAGERRVCIYPLTRATDSMNDLLVDWAIIDQPNDPGPAGNVATWVFGRTANLTLTATPTCEGNPPLGTHHVRISLNNLGPTSVNALRFGSCLPPFPAFSVRADFPGGCGPSVGPPGGCFMGGVGWTLGPTAPGQAQSCLLALSDSSSSGLASWPLRIHETYSSPFGRLYAHDPSRGRIDLAIPDPPLICGGTGGPGPAVGVPALRFPWIVVLALLLVCAAAVAHAVRRNPR